MHCVANSDPKVTVRACIVVVQYAVLSANSPGFILITSEIQAVPRP